MKTDTKTVKKEIVLKGTATSPGIAIGPAYIFRPFSINIAELETKVDDDEQEIVLFENAIRQVRDQLEFAQLNSQSIYQDQFVEIFESQKAFLQDPVLISEIKQEITRSGSSAAYAISSILSQKSEYFINLENTYFRERAYDITDLKHKLINSLFGIDIDYQLTNPSIVVAEILSPADTIHFNRNFIFGFLTDKGGKTSHAAIMARGLRIPSVVNGYHLTRFIQQDDLLIIDGFEGTVIINPSEKTKEHYRKRQKEHQQFENSLHDQINLTANTKDGHLVELLANIEFLHEINDVKKNNADGIGLFRTESIFIEKNVEPNEEEQFNIYKQLAEHLLPGEVTIRTVDVGGDKLIDGYSAEDELNPFLGWRAIRICLDRPQIFKTQLRAIYRASSYGKIKILIPMISSVEEILKTKKIIAEVISELSAQKIPHKKEIPLGIMIETPAAAMSARIFAEYVDYFSIGTNDLTQYVLAIDRTNDKVSKFYNSFNPAVLEFVARTIRVAHEKKIDVTICGEFAATPEAIPLLLGMGLRSFSMNPFMLPEAKKIMRAVALNLCEDLFAQAEQMHTAEEIEKLCQEFLITNVPDLKFIK